MRITTNKPMVVKNKTLESEHDAKMKKRERDLDEAALESFPASDPPAWVNCGKKNRKH